MADIHVNNIININDNVTFNKDYFIGCDLRGNDNITFRECKFTTCDFSLSGAIKFVNCVFVFTKSFKCYGDIKVLNKRPAISYWVPVGTNNVAMVEVVDDSIMIPISSFMYAINKFKVKRLYFNDANIKIEQDQILTYPDEFDPVFWKGQPQGFLVFDSLINAVDALMGRDKNG